MLLGDLIATGLALLVALYFWSLGDKWYRLFTAVPARARAGLVLSAAVAWIILMIELYDMRRASRRTDTARGIGMAALVGFGFYLVVFFFVAGGSAPARRIWHFSGRLRDDDRLAVYLYRSIYRTAVYAAGVDCWSGKSGLHAGGYY